jgi:hypothetical protein
MNLFKVASKEKFRFKSPVGFLTVEDLWALPLSSKQQGKPNLDDVARAVNKELNDKREDSFVKSSSENRGVKRLSQKLDLVKLIIQEKQDENKEYLERQKKKELKNKLVNALAKKQEESILELSEEELLEQINSLP